MRRKGPRPYLRGSETEAGVVLSLYEARQGALRVVERWTEPDIGSILSSGELVNRLEAVRKLRKTQGK